MDDHTPIADPSGYWAYTNRPTWIRENGAKRNRAERTEQTDAIKALTAHLPSVLYAVQLPDGTVKIGCTTNFAARRHGYGPHTVLAIMPGDRAAETEIHRSLRPFLTYGREWYRPTDEVFDVVNTMRDHFNMPHLAA